MEFKKFRRTQIAEMKPVTQKDIDSNALKTGDIIVSISQADVENGSPKIGDMVARNPKNHRDMWLVAAKYFNDNFEKIE